MKRPIFFLLLPLIFSGSVLAAPITYDSREAIADQYKWDLEDIFATDEAWEKSFTRLEGMIPTVATFKGKLAGSGTLLLGALEFRDHVREIYDRLLVYASMRHDQDTRVEKYAGMRDRIESVGTQLSESLAFLEPELLSIPWATLSETIQSTPGLEVYDHHLEDLFRGGEHVLDEEGERLMAMSGDVTHQFGRVFGAFHNADITYGTMLNQEGKEVELTKGMYRVFQESPDRRVREESWKLFYRAYESFGHTLAANMSGNVRSHRFQAKARGYKSSLEASLHPHAVPTQVYRNLVSTVRANLQPLHRYAAMRKHLLGVDTLQVWDMSAPLVGSPDNVFTWEEAVELVGEGLSDLGEGYTTVFYQGLESGWADVYETPGKRSGAYSWGAYGTKPYMLMNYRGTLDNVFTLAHEMGHSMHSYFAAQSQPYVYADYPTFLAEVASTVNEAIMIEKMLEETTDRDRRLFLLNHYLEQIRGTFFTQVLFADIELQMHERIEGGESLTKEALGRMYNETYQAYFGPVLRVDPLNGAAWSRIPHFYYNFYMYQYATSYAAATALAKAIQDEGQPAVDRLMSFLSSGGSAYPLDTLELAGIDMNSPGPILDTIAVFEDLLDELEAELAAGE